MAMNVESLICISVPSALSGALRPTAEEAQIAKLSREVHSSGKKRRVGSVPRGPWVRGSVEETEKF